MRWPVAAKTALAMLGAIGGTPGSPTPEAGASLGRIWGLYNIGNLVEPNYRVVVKI